MKLTLPSPVSLPVGTAGGGVVTRTLSELPVTLIDSHAARRIQVVMPPLRTPLTLWQGDAYTQLGAYTQSQVLGRITELLADDWQANLSALSGVTPQA